MRTRRSPRGILSRTQSNLRAISVHASAGPRLALIARGTLAAALALGAVATVSAQSANPYHQAVNGMEVYFGVMAAEIVRGHPATQTEARMHTQHQPVPGEKHVVVAIFDAASGARITDATATLRVIGGGPERPLELMNIAGSESYGNYLTLPDQGSHKVRVVINRPGQSGPVAVTFPYPLP